MKTEIQWSVTDQKDSKYLGAIVFQDNNTNHHYFELIHTKDRVAFGGICNGGFVESGYIERKEFESLSQTIQELISDLEVYYNDGPSYVSRIICNQRM